MQIVPGSENSVAIELISTHIRRQLNERSNQFRQKMAIPRLSGLSVPRCCLEDLNLVVLPQTPQLKVGRSIPLPTFTYLSSQGMITIIRDITTSRQDFLFFVDRLATLLVEHALAALQYRPKSVMTPVGIECHGKELATSVSCTEVSETSDTQLNS
jgi:uridine kinase